MNLQTSDPTYRLGFIGAGNLAGSVIRGLTRAKFCPPREIIASEPNAEVRLALRNETGIVVSVDEEQIEAVTALSGSGPAFVYTVIESLAEGGKQSGLPSETAAALATQTVLGAAQLASESKLSPEELRRMVVTPGGTTAAGVATMEKLGTSESLIAAVEAATKRGQEMAKENQ